MVGPKTTGVLLGVALLTASSTAFAVVSGGTSGSAPPRAVEPAASRQAPPGAREQAPGRNSPADFACPQRSASGSTVPGVGSDSHVFTRETADAITIRVYGPAGVPTTVCGPLPAPANPVAPTYLCAGPEYTIEMSDTTAVGEGSLGSAVPLPAKGSASGTATAGADEPAGLSSGAFGVLEADPVWWVALRVGGDVGDVKARFGDGTADEMTPVSGVAVLAHRVDPSALGSDPYQVTATLQLLDTSGAVLATVTLPIPAPTPVPPPTPVQGAAGQGADASAGSATSGPPTESGAVPSSSGAGAEIVCPMTPLATASPPAP